jgi:hypothetical protein
MAYSSSIDTISGPEPGVPSRQDGQIEHHDAIKLPLTCKNLHELDGDALCRNFGLRHEMNFSGVYFCQVKKNDSSDRLF